MDVLRQYPDMFADVRYDDRYHAIRTLVQPDDTEVQETARVLLRSQNFITACHEFVHGFTRYGLEIGDYWRTPRESLAKREGIDCDDSGILLCSLLRAGGISARDVYCAFGNWDGEGHVWVVMRDTTKIPVNYLGGMYLPDRILESTASPGSPVTGNYDLMAIFNDCFCFATDEALKEFELRTSPAGVLVGV